MIELIDVSKSYHTRQGPTKVLQKINMSIQPGEKVGILGRNGAGKSTLIRLLSGAEMPTSGRIKRQMKVSWPIAFSGGFQGALTGYDNLRFICRIYGVDFEPLVPFVQEFTELGKYLREPVKNYSSGMRSRLAFAISMAVEFDCYLIDEALAVGDSRFTERCKHELFEKRNERSIVIVSHQPRAIKQHCNTVYVLSDGNLVRYTDIDTAYHIYQDINETKSTG